jgi:hypothetical protein
MHIAFDGHGWRATLSRDEFQLATAGVPMSLKEIGCCGAYCRTCRAYGVACKGCKIGYDTGERDIAKARCKIKLCCLSRQLETCADCSQYMVCRVLAALYAKSGYKYGKYRQALDYVRENGYEAFLVVAGRWTGAYGKYPPPSGETKSRRTSTST